MIGTEQIIEDLLEDEWWSGYRMGFFDAENKYKKKMSDMALSAQPEPWRGEEHDKNDKRRA